MENVKIITLMPTRGLVFTKTEQALEEELLRNDQVPYILRTDDQPLPDCRNNLVETALSIPGWTHALLMDDDVILPEGGLKEMIDLDADIAFCDYPMHYSEGKWGAMGTATYDDWLPGMDWRDKPVAWAGLGCTLVKREVFEKLPNPWFKIMGRTFNRDDNGHITLNSDDIKLGGGGEDTYFMINAREAGFTIKASKKDAGHARLVRAVLALQEGKYQTQHKIAVNHIIKSPIR